METIFGPLEMFTFGLLTKAGLNPQFNKVKKKKNKIGKMILKARDEIEKSGSHKNTFVGGMIEFNKNNSDKISDEDMIGNIVLFVFAAYDTSRHSTGWSLHYLSKNKNEADDLRKEAVENEILEKIKIEKLDELKELDCYFKESLRLGAPFNTSEIREAKRSVKIGGIKFKKGDMVMTALLVNHFKEDKFPEAFKFDRKRHYEPKYERMSLIPFGAGSRGCIGKYLARMNIKMILLIMMRYFDVETDEGFDCTNEGMPFHTLNKVMLRLRLRKK